LAGKIFHKTIEPPYASQPTNLNDYPTF